MLAILLLILELFFMYFLYKKYKLTNAIVIVFAIIFFYCNSIVIDLYFLLNTELLYSSFVVIDRNESAFNLTVFSYFLFLTSYFLFFYYTKSSKRFQLNKIGVNNHSHIFIYLAILIMIVISYLNSQVTRVDLKESGNILMTTASWFIMFYWAYVIFCVKGVSNKLIILYSIVAIIYCVFTYEREPIIFIGVVLSIKFSKVLNVKYLVPIGVISIFILSYYKAFYAILLGGYGTQVFWEYVGNNPVSLAKMDPVASFGLLYDYFDAKPHFYNNFDFTYIMSFIDQFDRYFNGNQNVLSMSKVASKYYVGDTYGLAYSMILESIINLSFLGPIFLAFVAKVIYVYLKRSFFFLNEVIDIMFIMFFLSFVRTELIVMSKVFIFPMIIFLAISKFNYIKNKKNHFTV